MINVNITGALAQAAGQIAKSNPDCAIQIEWREGSPENVWVVTATDGVNDTVYIVDDESGVHAPTTDAELASFGVPVAAMREL